MKINRRILSAILAVILCFSLAVGVSAASSSGYAGIYGTISGNSAQSTSSYHQLDTRTSVSQNPDSAILKTTVEFTDGVNYLSGDAVSSARGAVMLSYNFGIFMNIEGTPRMAYTAHRVEEGYNSPVGYACYNSTPISY